MAKGRDDIRTEHACIYVRLYKSCHLSPLGQHMSNFPLDPPLSNLLLFACEHGGCSTEMLIIVC
jgi:HrpA-like RNA helicase